MPFRRWLLAIAFAASAVLLAAPAPAADTFHGSPPAAVPGADTSRAARWRADLAFIDQQVRTRHPRPFTFSREADFDSARRAIEARVATADDATLAVECMRMVAALGDGHTMLIGTFPQLGFTSVLPIALRPFEDGLYVTGADADHAALAGSRVVKIGGVPADEALARATSAVSGDNRYTRFDRVPLFLMVPAFLRVLGLAASESVELDVERNGRTEHVTVAGGAPPAGFPNAFFETEPELPAGWVSARRAGAPPRCDQRPEEAWWLETLPGSRTVYVRLRRIDPIVAQRRDPENYRHFWVRLFARVDSLKPAAVVLDLRHDHGGNNTILDPLIRGIVERPWLDRDGRVFALIDRGTFSAAMNAAVFLDNQTRVTFVGEPTGGRVNHYGDAPHQNTPSFGMMLQVSTLPWFSRDPNDRREWIAPHVAVPWTFASWRDGGDPALDAALDAAKRGPVEQAMLAASKRGGADAAAAAYGAWWKAHPNPWSDDPTAPLLAAVSERMDRGAWQEAADLGEASVKFAPESPVAWRVLGEAQLSAGHRARGIECLRQVIKLNPNARVAPMILRQLGETP